MPAESTGAFLDAVAIATGAGRFDPSGPTNLWMTWDMLRKMQDGGMSIGGHTVSHSILSRMPRDLQWEEIDGCRRRLVEELGTQMFSFSYPVGGRDCFNEDTRQCLRDAGVQFAFSYYSGYCRFNGWDQYDLPRVAIESYVTRNWFRSIVSLPQVFCRPR